jgi:3-methyladenine DNA glycosylase AlkD
MSRIRAATVLEELRSMESARNRQGMARYGINTERALGVSIATLRPMARRIGKDHRLAEELWASGIHEARILASMLADPLALSPRDMDRWVREIDSWDLCDQVCANLFERTPHARRKALLWSRRKQEFVKRAGFSLMARIAVSQKGLPDTAFTPMVLAIRREAGDERNYVKKAVNWALRQIGKRNPALRSKALAEAARLRRHSSAGARWVGRDAERELLRRRRPDVRSHG